MVESIHVGTLNIWNKSGPWDARLPLIRRGLAERRLDLLGLQEVLRLTGQGVGPKTCQALELAEGLDYHVAFGAAAQYGGGLELGNALLSRFPILEERCVPLPDQGSGETRSLLFVRLATPHGELPVFVTHLNWKLHHGVVRVAQVRHIVRTVFELCPLDETRLPPVLMGDFNAEPDSDEIRHLMGRAVLDAESVYFADAWAYGGPGPGYTFDPQNRFAALAHEPPRRIDYIFVRGPDRFFRGEPLATSLAFHEPEATSEGVVWPSDHFGVVTELAVSKRDA